MTDDCRHPEIEVELSGGSDNALSILANVRRALIRGGVPAEEVQEFVDEAKSGDYDHLLQTCMAWVDVS